MHAGSKRFHKGERTFSRLPPASPTVSPWQGFLRNARPPPDVTPSGLADVLAGEAGLFAVRRGFLLSWARACFRSFPANISPFPPFYC